MCLFVSFPPSRMVKPNSWARISRFLVQWKATAFQESPCLPNLSTRLFSFHLRVLKGWAGQSEYFRFESVFFNYGSNLLRQNIWIRSPMNAWSDYNANADISENQGNSSTAFPCTFPARLLFSREDRGGGGEGWVVSMVFPMQNSRWTDSAISFSLGGVVYSFLSILLGNWVVYSFLSILLGNWVFFLLIHLKEWFEHLSVNKIKFKLSS